MISPAVVPATRCIIMNGDPRTLISVSRLKGVGTGSVIITLKDAKGRMVDIATKLNSDGSFRTQIPPTWTSAQGYYVAAAGYGDCYSQSVP